MKLTDNEKRDIVKYLEAGKPLPEKYRFLLFDDDREVELLWNGKTNEVTNVVLPFQTIEQIDEPRSGEKTGWENSLFDMSGRQISGWTNKLIWGDNKLILSSLKNGPMRKEIEAQGGLKLIYIDPPFDVGADFSMDITIGDPSTGSGQREETFTKKPSVIEEIAYRDTWGKGADSFIAMIYERLKLMHDLLAEDGSIYVHCDWRLSGHLRLVMDEVFGEENLVNEIIWSYPDKLQGNINGLPKNHDNILFYKKTPKFIWNGVKIQLDKPRKINARIWNPDTGKLDTKRDKDGKVIYNTYSDKGADDVWIIPQAEVTKRDNTGYPTEKPMSIIERVIKASTNSGDLVADFFCGSGTTLAVAEKLGRKWIGSDLGKFGIHTSRKRLIGVQRELKKAGKDFRAFEILNVGRYERESFLAVNDDLRAEEKAKQAERKEKEFVKLIISAYKAESVDQFVNIVGKKRDRLVAVGPINMPVSSKFIEDIVAECKEKGITKADVLGFDYEMGLDFGRYKDQGIDIAFKIIPREVFDKKAVEKGQVKFYDVAFIEAKPIITGKGDKKEISIELADFSCSYSQDDITEIIEGLKPGGSKIILDNGKLIKVSKDKKTEEISQDILTKKWSDWIDYWAVDFDFADRKEMIRVEKKGSPSTSSGQISSYEEIWTGDYVFDNEWQSFRTKKNRNLELVSASKATTKGTHKIAIKVVDIFGNDTTRVVEVRI